MVWVLFIVSSVLISVEYLHFMRCKLLLPLYVVSSTRRPCEFLAYPMALMISGLWCFGILCFGSLFSGIMLGVLLSLNRFVGLPVLLVVFAVCGPLVV